MNHNVYKQLSKKRDINLIENVNPAYPFVSKFVSKCMRMAGKKSVYPAFTSRRLDVIKKLVESRLNTNASLNFFHGATPWLHVESSLPYAMYLDCCFATYINVYHNPAQFSKKQQNDLFEKESSFLEKAKAVFFSSQWAMKDTKIKYSLTGNNFYLAGLGGGFSSVCKKLQTVNPYFLFVGLDFLGKGGDKVVKAFTSISKKFPEFKLKIAGQKPPVEFLRHQQIEYAGLINKSNAGDLKKLTDLFCNAYCFVLPTSKDITPLVLVEAASVGCPAIATNNFGIPEIVKDGETGFLVSNDDLLEEQLREKMILLCSDIQLRNKTGIAAKKHIDTNFNWDNTGNIICEKISFSEN